MPSLSSVISLRRSVNCLDSHPLLDIHRLQFILRILAITCSHLHTVSISLHAYIRAFNLPSRHYLYYYQRTSSQVSRSPPWRPPPPPTPLVSAGPPLPSLRVRRSLIRLPRLLMLVLVLPPEAPVPPRRLLPLPSQREMIAPCALLPRLLPASLVSRSNRPDPERAVLAPTATRRASPPSHLAPEVLPADLVSPRGHSSPERSSLRTASHEPATTPPAP